jgi:GMP synthase (glutamine-hydrolysing)
VHTHAEADARAVASHRIAFLQHGPLELPGVLGTLAEGWGFEVQCVRADRVEDALPDPGEFAAVVVLGSVESVNDTRLDWVALERLFVASAVDRQVAIFGVCFGGQLLAQVLGGRVVRSPEPEVGWSTIHSDDSSTVAPGPWLLWHEDAITPPPGATVIASTKVALQAYTKGRHTGVQFHPEVTADIVRIWVDDARQRGEVTPSHSRALSDNVDELARASAANAGGLFEGFLRRAGLLVPPA